MADTVKIPAQKKLQRMINQIRQEILSGSIKHGEFLPSEKILAKKYGISNVTVRQGLDVLVEERLIEKIPRVGNRVNQPEIHGIKTVKFAYYKSMIQEAALEQLVSSFHEKYPNIGVNLISVDDPSKMVEIMESEQFDVLTINHNGFLKYKEHNGKDVFESFDFDAETYPFLKEPLSMNGQLKAKPFIFSPLVLCYNKDHFQEKELLEPDSGWQWGELFEIADKLAVDHERLGFYCHILSHNRWPVFLMQSGERFRTNEEGQVAICNSRLMDGMKACRDLVSLLNRNPFLSENDEDAEELFFNGKVSMIMTSYMRLNHYAHDLQFPFELAPLPYLNEPATLLQVIGLAVNHRSTVKESARCFIDYMTSYEAQLMIRQHTLSIPAHKRAAEWSGEEKIYRPSRFFLYRDIIPTYRLIDWLNLRQVELNKFRTKAKLYWSGLVTEDQVCRQLEELLNEKAAK